MFSSCDDLYVYRNIFVESNDIINYTEPLLQNNYFKKDCIRYNDTINDFDYILDILYNNNIDIIFTHHNIEQGDIISHYKNNINYYVNN